MSAMPLRSAKSRINADDRRSRQFAADQRKMNVDWNFSEALTQGFIKSHPSPKLKNQLPPSAKEWWLSSNV
jgi:hypothetical protein